MGGAFDVRKEMMEMMEKGEMESNNMYCNSATVTRSGGRP